MGIFRAQLHMCADMQFAYFAIIWRENMVFCISDKYALHKVHSFGIFRSLFKISGFHWTLHDGNVLYRLVSNAMFEVPLPSQETEIIVVIRQTKFFELPLELSLLLFST
jgi:hypothetical protein